MLEKVISGRRFNFGFSELKLYLLARSSSRVLLAILYVLFCVSEGNAQAQSAGSSISAYAEAINKSTIAERIAAMEHYLTLSNGGSLKTDALEFLVWDHWRLGHVAQSTQRAKELLAISPANPIAIAVLNQNPSSTPREKNAAQNQLAALKSAMSSLDHVNKPEGMLDRNFQILKQQVAIMLTGATGMSYLEIEDYTDARPALQQAVGNDPNNAQWVYGLGLALLNGKNRDQYHGYWYLARAANLTSGTPQGQSIANYARGVYHADGGKDAGWERFLASAAALDSPPSAESSTGTASANATTAASSTTASAGRSNASLPNASLPNVNPNQPTANRSQPSANQPSITQPSANQPSANNASGTTAKSPAPYTISKTKTNAGFEDTLRGPVTPEPTSPPPVPANRPRVMAAPSDAVSLGIMIETSLLTNENRKAIIATLKDIVRNLRVNDEAAILVFSDQLDFEQDLTTDDQLLEDAISQIRPKPGKALLPGIAFAAGHLKRIGRNSNRILLVISDGRSSENNTDTVMFRSQVSGVRIDCVGLKTAGEMERALLERVAAYSGGKASFASGPGEFRTAALEMTRTMGIAVP